MKRILFFLAVASVSTLSAQISLSESFETTPNAAKGFTIEGFSSSGTPSGCTGKALSKNFYSSTSNVKTPLFIIQQGLMEVSLMSHLSISIQDLAQQRR